MSNKQIIVQLPFSGFYHSIHDMHIDSFIEQELYYFENEQGYDDEQMQALNDNLYSMDYAPIRKAVCDHYINAFNAVFYDEYNIHLDLEFSELKSPQFYNFETDKLFCSIDESIFNQVIELLNDGDIQDKLKNKYKTRDGFYCFESTIKAIQNKDYQLFSADLLEMLLSEDVVIDDYQYADNISEVISNSAEYEGV